MQRPRDRATIPLEYTWDLTLVYADDAACAAALNELRVAVPGITHLQGAIQDADSLLTVLKERDSFLMRADRLITYSGKRVDTDRTDAGARALFDQAVSLHAHVVSAFAFVEPEILGIPPDLLARWQGDEPGLAPYGAYLERLSRGAKHVRSAEVEAVIADSADVARVAADAYEALINVDLVFPQIKDEQGHAVQVSDLRYFTLLESPDRRVRRDAFESFLGTLRGVQTTAATLLGGSVRAQVLQARQRCYSSSLAAALEPNEVPLDVYHTLLTSVRAGLPLLHRYLSLRKQILGVDELHLYDVRAPLVPTVEVSFDYPSAQEIVRKALACLGSEYCGVLDQILTSRWIDVYETPHKYGIPYSDGSYTTPPFTLLNFHGTLASLGSMAHELGHAAHAYFSRSVQPYISEDPASFVAEVASNLNEALVTAYLTETSHDPAVRLHLIADEIDSIRFTIFRQAMFAQFELEMHERVEAGDALTADWLCSLYASLVREFHGPDVAIDQLIAWEWILIPHFFSPFYVYQYATGKAAALALREHILSEGAPAVRRYIQFLNSGSSRSPMMLLRDTGADMSTPLPLQRALEYFSALLDELESRAIRTL